MSSIHRVALAGASGNLGPAILEQLLAANFHVTVLTRIGSSSNFGRHSNLTVSSVDYNSFDSLTKALHGHDVLVSTLGSLALATQLQLVDAAISAGVKRIIPSEFGVDTSIPANAKLPVFGDKVKVREHLVSKSKISDTSYTLVFTNVFFDWGINSGFVVNLKDRTAELYNGGNVPFSTTNLRDIGLAVVGVLHHPEQTKNRAVQVHSTVTTQNQLIAIAEKLYPNAQKFNTQVLDTKTVEADAYKALEKNPGNMGALYGLIKAAIWRGGSDSKFEHVDNDLLGVKILAEKEIEDIVKVYAGEGEKPAYWTGNH